MVNGNTITTIKAKEAVRGYRAKMPICDFDTWHVDSNILEVVLTPFTKQDAECMEDLNDDNFKIEYKGHEDK